MISEAAMSSARTCRTDRPTEVEGNRLRWQPAPHVLHMGRLGPSALVTYFGHVFASTGSAGGEVTYELTLLPCARKTLCYNATGNATKLSGWGNLWKLRVPSIEQGPLG